MINFANRSTEIELMDNPNLSRTSMAAVYRDIDITNRLLGGNKLTLSALESIIDKNPTTTYSVIDVGCGNGSMLRTLARYAKKRKLNLKLLGIELNEQSLEIARAASTAYENIQYLKADILSEKHNGLHCDFLLCTLTLHHFTKEEIPIFLKRFQQMANKAIVINDLQRSKWAYYLFKVFSAIFIKTKIAKNDGLVSIRRGFIRSELNELSQRLPAMRHEIKWKWAFRYAWVMHVNQPKHLA